MISLRPSGPEPERHQHRPPQGSHAGLALQHHAVQHQHRIAVRERPGMKRGHRDIPRLATRLTVLGLTGSPSTGNSALGRCATLMISQTTSHTIPAGVS